MNPHEMTNYLIIELYEILCKLSEDPTQLFDIETGYKIIANKHILKDYYDRFLEARKAILEKYGTIQQDGSIQIDDDKINKANSEIEFLLKLNVGIVPIEIFNINKLYDSNYRLTLKEIERLAQIADLQRQTKPIKEEDRVYLEKDVE